MTNLIAALTIFAVIGSGLVAGTFFAFSTFIMQALTARPADEAMAAMKEINVVVVRSPFIAVFVGTAIASLILMGYAIVNRASGGSYMMIAAAAIYVIFCFGITMAFNVPQNNRLAAAEPGELMSGAAWEEYRESWTRWNHVRTLAAIVSSILFAGSLLY